MNGTGATGASRLLPSGLTLSSAMRSRLKNREISTRKQVGDAESMVNEETVPGTTVDKAYLGWDDEEV